VLSVRLNFLNYVPPTLLYYFGFLSCTSGAWLHSSLAKILKIAMGNYMWFELC